jgi:hypothetical protein
VSTSTFRAGRVEYVPVLCTVCHHLFLRDESDTWTRLRPIAPAQRHAAHSGDLTPSLHPERRFTQNGPIDEWATDRRVRAEEIGDLLYHGAPSHCWRRLWLAVLILCIMTCACAIAGVVLYPR